MANAFFITSGRWLRIAPDDSSTPLQTMSYWIALMPRMLLVVVRIEREELVRRPCSASRTGCARSRSSSPPRSIRTSGSRRSSRTSNRSLAIRSKLLADLGARGAGELHEVLRLAGDEEHRVADAELELLGDLLGALRPDVLGERARRRPPRPRARRCSRAPAGPRPAPRNSCGRRTRGCRRSAPGSPRPRSWDRRRACWRKS